MRAERLEESVDGTPYPCRIDRRIHRTECGVGPLVCLRDDSVEQGQQHRVLRREIEVERRSRNPGTLGQIVDRDLGERTPFEQSLGGFENGQLTVVAGGPGDSATTRYAGLAGGCHGLYF